MPTDPSKYLSWQPRLLLTMSGSPRVIISDFNNWMLRKNIRMRREFLYTLEKEQQQKQTMDKKLRIQQADDNNDKIPTELFKESHKLR